MLTPSRALKYGDVVTLAGEMGTPEIYEVVTSVPIGDKQVIICFREDYGLCFSEPINPEHKIDVVDNEFMY